MNAPIPDPIPCDSLRTLLISLEPQDLSLQDKKTWYKKIDDTVSCYEEYVNTVCGEVLPLDGGMRHAVKWDEFRSLLKSWGSLGYNYSVHY